MTTGVPRHLSSLRMLREHIVDGPKEGGYRSMLRDLGVDPSKLGVLSWHPTLIVAEQLGNWFYPEDRARYELLVRLVDRGGVDPRSGVMTVVRDGFSTSAMKAFFTSFRLYDWERNTSFIGTTAARRHRHRCYDALPLSAVRERIDAILELAVELLDSSASGVAAYRRAARRRFDEALDPACRPLLPAGNDRRALEAVGRRLAACDATEATTTLERARARLDAAESWAGFWTLVNEDALGRRIAPLDPLFNRMVLAIEDPFRTASTLRRWTGVRGPIPLVGIVDDARKYRLVSCEPGRARLRVHGDPHSVVEWDWIREQAHRGLTGGPAVILEYLMMAAIGIYGIADRGDGRLPFERTIRTIHHHYTGLPWPSVVVPGAPRPEQTYVDLFTPTVAASFRSDVDAFFHEDPA